MYVCDRLECGLEESIAFLSTLSVTKIPFSVIFLMYELVHGAGRPGGRLCGVHQVHDKYMRNVTENGIFVNERVDRYDMESTKPQCKLSQTYVHTTYCEQ